MAMDSARVSKNATTCAGAVTVKGVIERSLCGLATGLDGCAQRTLFRLYYYIIAP